jgi:hypothetical protein
MDALSGKDVEPGMQVYDSSGYRVGTVAFAFDDLIVESDCVHSEPAVEVKTGLFGLGRHLHIPLADIERVCPGAVFLARGRAELEQAERAHLHHLRA